MMTDWKVGDLALCVKLDMAPSRLRIGAVYTVRDLNEDWLDTECGLGLVLKEVDAGPSYDGFTADKFRRLAPHTEDEDDREVIAHMIYAPVSHDVKQAFAAEKGE